MKSQDSAARASFSPTQPSRPRLRMALAQSPPLPAWPSTVSCMGAPGHDRIEVHLLSPEDRIVSLDRQDRGYHAAVVDAVLRPAPAMFFVCPAAWSGPTLSRLQAEGVHGPSTVVGADVRATIPGPRDLADYVIYELHVGTFTPAATSTASSSASPTSDLGITAVELMPVASSPASATGATTASTPTPPQTSYGGPDGLQPPRRRLPRRGLASSSTSSTTTSAPRATTSPSSAPTSPTYKTPWGAALNFDGPAPTRSARFFIDNALYWLARVPLRRAPPRRRPRHLRPRARPFLQELTEAVHAAGRRTAATSISSPRAT